MRELQLTSEGRPLKPHSIFLGIKRACLPSRVRIELSLRLSEMLVIPVCFCGQYEFIVGVVRHVRMFTDGMLVLIDPRHENSTLKAWPCAPLWIPNHGGRMAGVLATWT